ncbi:MAG: anthranilate phosphoribosyltransferase, partial [Planctomycetales bacterium]
MIEQAILQATRGKDLSQQETADAVDAVMRGDASEIQTAALLTALHFKGESVEEIAGAASALRGRMTPIATRHEVFIDTCGTGGDGSGTFNISTAAALVTAAAGLPVAKHGNRAVTSQSGSADVLTELGVNVQADLETMQSCLDDVGICFCFAPLFHRAMKHAAPVRKRLGFPTVFNCVGPLANPAKAPLQLIGVGKPELREKIAGAMTTLGYRKGLVVWAEAGLDEISCEGNTLVSRIDGGSVSEETWSPEDFGLEPAPLDSLRVSSPQESAA